MELFVTVKQVGKKHALLAKRPITFSTPPKLLRELIAELVRREVARFLRSAAGEPAILLTEDEIALLAEQTGKVGFSTRCGERSVNEAQALETAYSAFRDGLFRVFWDRSKGAGASAYSVTPSAGESVSGLIAETANDTMAKSVTPSAAETASGLI